MREVPAKAFHVVKLPALKTSQRHLEVTPRAHVSNKGHSADSNVHPGNSASVDHFRTFRGVA